ncbi:uncharacterized protein LOC120742626 [Simochromis diagramma]|uniref:uncharacterized protein LOC120742626 n=1 Tax=Simochromis diagramma TaxID=43689 RepID=UPI001A7E2AD8|nr:uncharacterized protein LOC120742626 [Simochromis diagramma]
MERAGQLSHCWTLLFLHFCLSASAYLVNITAESGQNVTLSCRANNNNLVTFLEWSKHGLRKGYLLLYRDERFDLENQHPSFKNRVELQDRQMKDGDVSLILKNVTLDDRGRYECRVETKINRRKRANQDDDPFIIISLNVVPPGQTGGDTEDGGKEERGREKIGRHSSVGVAVSAVLLLGGFVVFLIYRKHKTTHNLDSYQRPAELQSV